MNSAMPAVSKTRSFSTVFLIEMWERFGYYGMQVLIVYYMVQRLAFTDSSAALTWGAAAALIYVSPAIGGFVGDKILGTRRTMLTGASVLARSEEHTSELQSHVNLVCRLLLEKKNIIHDLRHKHRETYKGAEMLFKEL